MPFNVQCNVPLLAESNHGATILQAQGCDSHQLCTSKGATTAHLQHATKSVGHVSRQTNKATLVASLLLCPLPLTLNLSVTYPLGYLSTAVQENWLR